MTPQFRTTLGVAVREWRPKMPLGAKYSTSNFKSKGLRGRLPVKPGLERPKGSMPQLLSKAALVLYADPHDVERSLALDRLVNELADQWAADTAFESSGSKLFSNPNYLQVMALGPSAIPHILQRMLRTGEHWFFALSMISRENPVPPKASGDIPTTIKCWKEWGRANGYLK